MSAAILAMVFGMAATAPSDPAVGKWGIDYGQSKCVITRAFPMASGKAIMAIDAGLTTGTGNIILFVPKPIGPRTRGFAKLSTVPAARTFSVEWSGQRITDEPSNILILTDEAVWTGILPAQTLSIDDIDHDPIAVPIHGIDKAVQAAQVCGRSLLRSWGADPDAMIVSDLSKRRIDWISYTDYPMEALRSNQQGTVGLLATINAAGKPIACRAVASSGVPSLDAASCRALMQRGSFDASEKPSRYLYRKIVWAIPSP